MSNIEPKCSYPECGPTCRKDCPPLPAKPIEPTESLTANLQRAARTIEAVTGWSVAALDVDHRAVRLEVRNRATGEVLTLDRDHLGRAQLVHEIEGQGEVAVGRRGDRQRVARIERRFIARHRPEGVRSGLRMLGQHISPRGWRSLLSPIALALTEGEAQ